MESKAATPPGAQGKEVDAVYFCLDVSGSIRSTTFYPTWVSEDIAKACGKDAAPTATPSAPAATPAAATATPAAAPTPAPRNTAATPEAATAASVAAPTLTAPPGVPLKWVLWGSLSEAKETLEEVQAYLADESETLGGTDPEYFVQLLPKSGVIDLHVYTDGEISEHSVTSARTNLARDHPDLKIRQVVVNYVNKNLDHMNVGLSVIFDGHVLEMHRTRVADGKKVHAFSAPPLSAQVPLQDIVSAHLALGRSEAEMTQGIHYLAQRFANSDPKTRQLIRRAVKEVADAVNLEHRTRMLKHADEAAVLAAAAAGRWYEARKPFIGHAVSDDVKRLQAYCQKFLNEVKQGALIRVSAYAPLQIRGRSAADKQFDVQEDVLLDHIMYLGLGKEAVVVVPVVVPEPEPQRRGQHPRPKATHVQCGLAFDATINFDNTFGLETLFQLRDHEEEVGVGDQEEQDHGDVLDRLSAQAHGDAAPDASVLSSGSSSFGVNPFTRKAMEMVLLVAADADALEADRLAELDAWNTHMMSRFVRAGRTMPSAPLLLALVLEKTFAKWDVEAMVRPEDRAAALRLRDVCRKYLARMPTPLTFGVGMPVVVQGTFATAARLACLVLQGALDPTLPYDVLTQFWYTITSSEEAAKVWAALRPYAGLPEDAIFPEEHHRSLRALVAGSQFVKSARDLKMRAKKGRAYSARMYSKRLDQLAREGCHPQRLRAEEKAVRQDLFGVPTSAPLLCAHGVDAEKCVAQEGEQPDVLCQATWRPTLLNPRTMDMWYVGQPTEPVDITRHSFHKAMWQLARKRTKGKKPRHSAFPPPKAAFVDFVNQRLRASFLERGDSRINVLPTIPCARLAQDIDLTYAAYADNVADKRTPQPPRGTLQDFVKALEKDREVCAAGPCCEFIRKGVSEGERAWINDHATHRQVAGRLEVLSGKVSYRQG